MDCSLPGSSVNGISQARVLESNQWHLNCRLHLQRYSVCVCVCVLSYFSHVQLFVTLWALAHQAPLSIGFSRQEYWSALSCPPPGIFPTEGWNPSLLCLLHWQTGSLPLAPPGEPLYRDSDRCQTHTAPKGCSFIPWGILESYRHAHMAWISCLGLSDGGPGSALIELPDWLL